MALAAYANAWPNALAHDDKSYRGSERFIALSNIPRYFTENAWATSGVSRPLYRPLLLTSVTLDARLYGDWVAGYHLTNLALHAGVCVLVFAFLLQLLTAIGGPTRADRPVALAVTLIFAVHPVHTEVVNSIFNRSDMLVALAGLAGLTWFLRRLASKPNSAWAGLGVAYLLALFCKESAVGLPGIAVVLALLVTPGNAADRVRKCLPVLWLSLPLALYLILRHDALVLPHVANSATSPPPYALASPFEPVRLPDIMAAFGFWFEAFKILLWPHPLSVAPTGLSAFSRIAGLALNLVLISLALHQATRRHTGLLVGLVMFYLASLPVTGLLGRPGSPVVLAEHYLYFPSVGLAAALAFALRQLAVRFTVRAVAGATLAVMVLCVPTVWARNADWRSDVLLYESDYRNGDDGLQMLVWLSAAYLVESRFDSAAEICDRHPVPKWYARDYSSHCAIAYERVGRVQEAEAAHLQAVRGERADPMAHANLAYFYLRQGRWRDAKEQFEIAVRKEKVPASRAVRRGDMLLQLYGGDRTRLLEAKAQFEEALELQPSMKQAEELLARVNRMLDAQPPE